MPTPVTVRFFSLVAGSIAVVRKAEFKSTEEATAAVEEHARSGGFTNVKLIRDVEFDGIRWTARTPGGRAGRNIADGQEGFEGDDEDLADTVPGVQS